jgi:hypothetical protein
MAAHPTIADQADQIQILPSGHGLVLRGELDLALRRELARAVDLLLEGIPGHVDLWMRDLSFIDVGCTTEVMQLQRGLGTVEVHDAPALFTRIVRTGWPAESGFLPA